MSFNDDEPIVEYSVAAPRPVVPGRVQLDIRFNNCRPLEENSQKVLLSFTGKETSRSGLDLVVVLDLSSSMNGAKLAELKMATLFVMKKLSLVDRLSIVKYSNKAERLCPLRQMTESSQMELQNLINDLKTQPGTNITDGLLTALKVLNDRSVGRGRVDAIMLMSDGEENINAADTILLGNVRVHTFRFGDDHDPKVLKAIAANCQLGGTYSDVCMANLNLPFEQCLGGLLSVIAQHLTVTIKGYESTIKHVYAGSYPQSMDNDGGSVTIKFGDIYSHEVRKVLVDVLIPATDMECCTDVLMVSYTFKFNGQLLKAPPAIVSVSRQLDLTAEEVPPEVRVEEVRMLIAEEINQATTDADKEDLKSAQKKLLNGLKILWAENIEKLNVELKPKLEELLKLMETQAIYKKHGRPFAYNLHISLHTQRQIARGTNIGNFQIFANLDKQELLEEAKELDVIDDPFMMCFNDDDPIVLPPDSGLKPIVPGRVQLVIRSNNKVPLGKNIHKVLLELSSGENRRSGLDLVAVLDVSSSMEGDKLAKMKKTMLFLLKKLSLIDRLSIVEYSCEARRLCPFRQITERSQTELENLIKSLKTQHGTNITSGLKMALKVLKDRSISSVRVGIIMLMSDGQQNTGGNAADVPVDNVPVHTFGFGEDQNLKVLKAIADNSRLGGTNSDIHMDNSSGGLLSVVAQELTVTVAQVEDESTIKHLSVGSYPQSMDNANGSVTISFGDIYIQELRKVLVDLYLPATNIEGSTDVLKVYYSYRFGAELFEPNPGIVTIHRMSGLTEEDVLAPPEVRATEVRLLIIEVIKLVTANSVKENLESAKEKLVDGLKILEDEDREQLKTELRADIEKLGELMQTQGIYKKQGRPFEYSLLISQTTLCQATRANNISNFQLFATPAIQEIFEEAKKIDDIDDLKFYMDDVIRALESIEMIINNL